MRNIVVFLILLLCQTPVFSIDKNLENTNSLLTNPEIIPQESDINNIKLEGGITFEEDNVIYLNKEIERPTLNIKNKNTLIPIYTPIDTNSRMRSRSALAKASKLTGEEYYITPMFHYINEQVGNFSYGSYHGASIDSAQMTYSSSIFTRYDAKYCALTGTFSTDSQTIDGVYKSMFGISPEIKLTNSLSIRDTIKTYMGVPVKKNQISLIYTPQLKKYIDGLRFELGLSQSFYENGANNSSIEFITRFKL